MIGLREAYLNWLSQDQRDALRNFEEAMRHRGSSAPDFDLNRPVSEILAALRPTALQMIAHTLAECFRKSLFQDNFIDGILVMSGVQAPLRDDTVRKVIPASLFEFLDFNYEKETARGPGTKWAFLCVHKADDLHLMELQRRSPAPATVSPGIQTNFTAFTLGEKDYRFGPMQANILGQLFVAHIAGTAWVSTKTLLDNARSDSTRLSDVFKSKKPSAWRELIVSDGRGRYRWNEKHSVT